MGIHTKLTIDGHDIELDSGPNTGEVLATLAPVKSGGIGSSAALMDLARDLRSLATEIEATVTQAGAWIEG